MLLDDMWVYVSTYEYKRVYDIVYISMYLKLYDIIWDHARLGEDI